MSALTPELRGPDPDMGPTGSAGGGGGAPIGESGGRRGPDRRIILLLLVIVVIAGGLALLLGTSSPSSRLHGTGTPNGKSASFLGDELSPPKPTPALSLRNYLGRPVNIAQYRGEALLVTFIYTHCPDVCPLIVAHLRVAQTLMGAKLAAKTQIIAVSVDPRGDTPQSVAAFLKVHEMTGRMQYLTGTAKELGTVWQTWGVGSERDVGRPGLVNHSALVYGISASGKLKTVYLGSSFKPSEIAHDVSLLASQ